MKKLTTQEAEQLIKMLKKTIEKEIHLPSKGTNIRFDVQGRTKKHIFSISLYNITARKPMVFRPWDEWR